MSPVIIDVAIAVVLLAAFVIGWRRGLFRTLAGVLILILAILGAGLVARTLCEPVAQKLEPILEERITEKFGEALTEKAEAVKATLREILPSELSYLFERTGLREKLDGILNERGTSAASEAGSAVATAVAEELAHTLVYAVLYILAFLILLLLLRLAARGVDLALKLPVLHGANALGGAAIGLAEGVLLVWLVLRLLPRFGVVLSDEGTYLLRLFTPYL